MNQEEYPQEDQFQKYQQHYPQAEPPKWKPPPIFWVVIIGSLLGLSVMLFNLAVGSHTGTLVQDTFATATAAAQSTEAPTTDTTQPTDTAITTAPSVADQVTQVLGSTLGPNDTVTESNGAVAVNVYTTTTVSLDDGGHARIFAVEKTIWQANISGISSVQVTVYELDTDGTQIPMYKALVSADRAQSIPWDSIAPDAAWRLQYNETWTCRGPVGDASCPYTTPVTNGP